MRRNLLRFIVKYHYGILFFLLELIALFILVQNNDYHKAGSLNLIQKIESSVQSRSGGLKQYKLLHEENEKLINENLELRKIISNLEVSIPSFDAKKDSMLSGQFEYIPAKVINNSTNKQYNFITLNKGEADGVKAGMGVISSNGVVGIVKSTSFNFSRVISLLNRDFLVSSKIKNSNYMGPVQWEGKNNYQANMKDISFHVHLNVGDTIITSGYSRVFPENIVVGYIQNFNLESGNYYQIEIDLATDFRSLSNVYIINNNFSTEILNLENTD